MPDETAGSTQLRETSLTVNYTVISDETTLLSQGFNNRKFSFNAPDVNAGLQSILLCVVQPVIEADPAIRLEMKLATRPLPSLTVVFRDNAERSVHAVLGSAHLLPNNNSLTLTFAGDAGKIRVSEIVLLYK